MPSGGFQSLIERIVTDDAFATRFQANSASILDEYGVTDDEKLALLSNNPAQLQALGLDERISKYRKDRFF